ncbi:MAG: hypothetical protein ABR521_10150 [Gaiellaceae bacterium]
MTFRRYAAERIALSVLVLAGSVFLAFLTVRLANAPDSARPEHARYVDGDAFLARFWDYVSGLLRGSLGTSIHRGSDLTVPLLEASTVTLSVAAGALVFGLLLGLPAGVLWGRHRRFGAIARLVLYGAFGVATLWPLFTLTYWLSLRAEILPLTGYCDFFNPATDCGGLVEWARHLLLPWICLGIIPATVYARGAKALVVRGDREAAAAAAAERPAVRARARARIAITFAQAIGRDVGFLVGAALFVEYWFGLPGLGRTMFAGLAFDPPLAVGALVLAALIALAADLVVNLVGAALTPMWRTR